ADSAHGRRSRLPRCVTAGRRLQSSFCWSIPVRESGRSPRDVFVPGYRPVRPQLARPWKRLAYADESRKAASPITLISSVLWATIIEAAKSSSKRISSKFATFLRRMKLTATRHGSQRRMRSKGSASSGPPSMLEGLSKLLMRLYKPCARQIRNSSSNPGDDFAGESPSDNKCQPSLSRIHLQALSAYH